MFLYFLQQCKFAAFPVPQFLCHAGVGVQVCCACVAVSVAANGKRKLGGKKVQNKFITHFILAPNVASNITTWSVWQRARRWVYGIHVQHGLWLGATINNEIHVKCTRFYCCCCCCWPFFLFFAYMHVSVRQVTLMPLMAGNKQYCAVESTVETSEWK